MGLALLDNIFNGALTKSKSKKEKCQNLTHGEVNRSYTIKGIDTRDPGMKDFLFTLGCYEGEKVTVISVLAENYIIHVKNSRYSIDSDLAKGILI